MRFSMVLMGLSLVNGEPSRVQGSVSAESGINLASPCVAGNLIYTNQSSDWTNFFNNCTTFNGTIFIDPSFPGDVILPDLVTINGGIGWFNNTGPIAGSWTGLVCPNLRELGDPPFGYQSPKLLISNITSVRTIWMPLFYNYTGEFVISDLPGLTNLSAFNDLGVIVDNFEINSSNVSSISITTNSPTGIFQFDDNPNLENFTLLTSEIGELYVKALDIMIYPPIVGGPLSVVDLGVSGCQNFDTAINSINGSFELYDSTLVTLSLNAFPVDGSFGLFNNSKLTTFGFDHFWASANEDGTTGVGGDFIISECPSLQNMSAAGWFLTNISGLLNITSNEAVTEISFPDLATVGSILISNCNSVFNISMPSLDTIEGDLVITNNTVLDAITGFTNLKTIVGKVHLEGNFSSVELPELTRAFDGFYLKSTNPALDCSAFEKYVSLSIIRGNFSCITPSNSPLNNGTEKNTTSQKHSLSGGAKGGIGAGVSVGSICLIAALAYLAKIRGYIKNVLPQTNDNPAELPEEEYHEKIEVPAISKPGELSGEPISGTSDAVDTRDCVSQVTVGEVGATKQNITLHELQ